MKDLISNILASSKKHFGLKEDATDVELHEAILASENKDIIVVKMASDIAEIVKAESAKQVVALEAETNSLLDAMANRVEALEAKLAEATKPENSNELASEFEKIGNQIEALKTEFGNEINTLKAADKSVVPGDGSTIQTHVNGKKELPVIPWGSIK